KAQESRAATAASARAPAAAAQAIKEAPSTKPIEDDGSREPRKPPRTVLIDHDALRAAAILPPANQERLLADEYRQIKRPLISAALGRNADPLPNGHFMMIASALPGDGKTFTSINLALSMALERDISVLLVDADVAKPHVSKIFGVDQERGLLDLLRDEREDVESLILPTSVPGLSLLPAGRLTETATELLASSRMEEIISQLAARDPNRIVLFDSPPLLLTSESRALATIVGQIVLVVKANSTPQRAVFDVLDLLGDGKSVNLVLNQATERAKVGYYQYYGERSVPQNSAPER